MANEKRNGINILVCGSSHVDDPAMVGVTLNALYKMYGGDIRKIITSRIPGVCEQAECWTQVMNDSLPKEEQISIDYFNYSGFNDPKNSALYEHLDIPDFALKNHSFYTKGCDELVSKGVSLVIAFPNKDGELGATTKNIQRFCTLSDDKIKFIDISKFVDYVLTMSQENDIEEKPSNKKSGVFNNKLGSLK